MADKKKIGFGGQWVDGTPIGKHVDSDGDEVAIDVAFLEAVVANFAKTKTLHQPPAVIGHPTTDAPAYGYVDELRVNNGRLERRFIQVNPQFEEIVKSGAYKKRSDAFYLDPKIAPGGLVPALRHVGFLGAQPPAIKGIQDIHFAEGDTQVKTVDVEVDTAISFTEGEQMRDEDVQKTIRDSVAEFFSGLFKDKTAPAAASFSEADAQRLIEGAVTKVQTSFEEKITTLENENKKLREVVDTQVGSSTRREIVAFCESHPTKVLPALKSAGIVEFMETLDATPVAKKITVITFAEKDGAEVEVKTELSQLAWFQKHIESLPAFVQFGESFGLLKVTGDGSQIASPGQIDALRDGMGVKKAEAKK